MKTTQVSRQRVNAGQTEVITRVARRAARAYSRKARWADVEEMEQEAWLVCLKSMHTFDPTRGVPLEAYLFRATVNGLRAWLWAQSSPVTASYRKRPQLRGTTREDTDMLCADACPAPTPEQEVTSAHWQDKAASRLLAVLHSDPDAEVAMQVLLDGVKPAALAEETGMPVERIYLATQRARRRIKGDAVCKALGLELV